MPEAGIVAVLPPEASTTEIGIKRVEYSVDIAEPDPESIVD
jgi:hypothetical protein